jgi:multidrug efflux system membrane fusion protein
VSTKNIIATLIAIAMGIWLFSGELTSNTANAGEEDEVQSNDDQIPFVRGMESLATPRNLYLEVRAQTEANRTVQIKSEIAGVIEAVPGLKGTQVKAGDLLCKIAVDARQSELNEASASLKSMQLEYDGVIDLKKRGLQSQINVAQAKAKLEADKTRTKRAELALTKTEIRAPFAGVIEMQQVEIGDFLSTGQVCVTLMEIDPMLVIGQVAEKNINSLSMGDDVEVELITGDAFIGKVSFIGRSPDATTRAYPVEVTVTDPGQKIRAGMTAQMRVPTGKELAHLISPASLVLNDEGVVGIRTVENKIVRFIPVKIIGEDPGGVWVSGVPQRTQIITVGQEDVFEGQLVRISLSPIASIVGLNR